MARIRTIKPDFFRHGGLQDLEAANPGLYPMMVFAGLWGHCDKAGRFVWDARMLKLDILPFLPFDMTEVLRVLEQAGFINKYEVNGKEYGEIPSFSEHQRINGKEAQEPEKHPSNPENQSGSNGEAQETTGREGKGKEGKGLRTSAPVCPEEVNPRVWDDFMAVRKAKRSPLTDTALEAIRREAQKAGYTLQQAIEECCERNWQGFKAEWVAKKVNGKPVSAKPWFIDSSTAITAKGRELGVPDCDSFPEYRLKVFKAAGITAEMVKQAEAMAK